MRYNTDTPPELLEKYVSKINSRWGQLNELMLSIVTDGIKYLFYVNAGGCVAMLTFIGTADTARHLQWPWTVLGIFFVGLFFVGVLNLARYHVLDYLLKGWNTDVSTFYSGDLEYSDLHSRDDVRVEKTSWILVFAYLAFLAFVAAGIYGFFSLQGFIKTESVQTNVTEKMKMPDPNTKHVPKMPPNPPPPQPPK